MWPVAFILDSLEIDFQPFFPLLYYTFMRGSGLSGKKQMYIYHCLACYHTLVECEETWWPTESQTCCSPFLSEVEVGTAWGWSLRGPWRLCNKKDRSGSKSCVLNTVDGCSSWAWLTAHSPVMAEFTKGHWLLSLDNCTYYNQRDTTLGSSKIASNCFWSSTWCNGGTGNNEPSPWVSRVQSLKPEHKTKI